MADNIDIIEIQKAWEAAMDGISRCAPDVRLLPGPACILGTRFDLERVGYISEDVLISGQALRFSAEARQGASHPRGNITIENAAPYCTRLAVFRPIDPERACGTIVVEWLNVKSGGDVPLEWIRTHRHLIRRGITWVGVSAQRGGEQSRATNGGNASLKELSPKRFETIDHPGDAFALDIFSQALRVINAGGLSMASPSCILAVGFSEAARFLTAYINKIDPHVGIVDGFLLSGRHRSAATLDGVSVCGERVPLRSDLRAPVFVLQSETDVFGRMQSFDVRQDDSDRYRLWEIAGSAHVDNYLMSAGAIDDGLLDMEGLAKAYAPEGATWVWPRLAINASPTYHYVEQAALHHLEIWARAGTEPPPGVVLAGSLQNGIARDAMGVALGGVRTPWVDCPAQIYSGVNDQSDALDGLYGSTTALSLDVLRALYPRGLEDYRAQFAISLRRTIDAGYLLEDDREENLRLACALYENQERRPL